MIPGDQTPPESRRRKLDDLFGDEPFLSPTMKARRLHEKMLEHPPMPEGCPAGQSGSPPDKRLSALLPEFVEDERPPLRMLRAEPPVVTGKPAVRREPEPPAGETPVTLSMSRGSATQGMEAQYTAKIRRPEPEESEPTGIISLARAADYLRTEAQKRKPESEKERLLRFRKDVLMKWLKDVPEREINPNGEER